MTIGRRLLLGFCGILLLTAFLSFLSIFQMDQLSHFTRKLHDHPLAVSNAVRDIRINIIAMHRYMKDVALAENGAQLAQAERLVEQHEREALRAFETVLERFLGDMATVTRARQSFLEWKVIRSEVIQLMRDGQRREAAAITKGKGFAHVQRMENQIQEMASFAKSKGTEFYDDAVEQTKHMTTLLLVAILLVILGGIGVALLTTRSLVTPIERLVLRMKEFGKGDFTNPIDISRSDEIGHLANSFRAVQHNLQQVSDVAQAISEGNLTCEVAVRGREDVLGQAINRMVGVLREVTAKNEAEDWLKTGLSDLSEAMAGDPDLQELSNQVVSFLTEYCGAQLGALYTRTEDGMLHLRGSYAFEHRKALNAVIEPGQGLVGQAALEKHLICISELPEDYMHVSSALGSSSPRNAVVVPLQVEDRLVGILELGAIQPFDDQVLEFLKVASERVGFGVESALARASMSKLLNESRMQATQLQEQQEELKASNEELEEKTDQLI
ncbi:MAG: HAMP domain-containing protein, partial [Planctomycetota bacterium]